MAKAERRERSLALYETITKLKDPEECCRFFEDLCTPVELRSMEQRFDVAVYLQQGLVYLDNGAGGIMRDVICRTGLDKREIPPISQETQESKVEVE